MGRKNSGYFEIFGKKYAFNLEKMREICLKSSENGGTQELEIAQSYDVQEDGDFSLSSKVERETKVIGNPQNDMIMYDLVKIFIVSLLENTSSSEDDLDFGTILSINTMIDWGLIYEVE